MASLDSFAAEENGDVSTATRAEAIAQQEEAPAELASASTAEISRANEWRPKQEDAAVKLGYDVNEFNPQAEFGGTAQHEIGSLNRTSQDEAAAEPVSSPMDPSSDLTKDTLREEDAAALSKNASTNEMSDSIKTAQNDVLARGIATVLGPVMNGFDGGVEGAYKSQSVLASSIDRLTRELDKLLEDVPLPFATQHATRLSGIRKRVLTLNSSLRVIQRRMDSIQRFRAAYALRAIAKEKQGKASIEKSHSHAPLRTDVIPTEGTPSSSVDDTKNAAPSSSVDDTKNAGGQFKKDAAGTEISDEFGNIRIGGSQDNNVQDESDSKNFHIDQEPHDDQKPNDDREPNDDRKPNDSGEASVFNKHAV